jgi:7-carboxy-7-deazaguanine synthase
VTNFFLDVSERFYSLQGESTWAGLPCLFIRLAGCNLRCNYCDSSYTWEETGKKTSFDEILSWVDEFPGTMVELTGGEPLLQKEVYPLIEEFLSQGRTVLVETNGSKSINQLPKATKVILDIKCPDSNMDSSTNWGNIEQLFKRADQGSHDEVKFVLSSEQDFLWAKKIVQKHQLEKATTILFSPVEGSFEPRKLAELILQYNLPVRLQLHRLIWPEHERGV